MEDYLKQVESAASVNNLYYLALGGALTIPDMCGALESANGEANGSKYKAWFDANATSSFHGMLSGNDCYRFRCSFLHQGSTQHPQSSYSRIIFIEPGAITGSLHMSVADDALCIDVKLFCVGMVSCGRSWLARVQGTEPYESNLRKFVTRYPGGLSPYIGGVPVIG